MQQSRKVGVSLFSVLILVRGTEFFPFLFFVPGRFFGGFQSRQKHQETGKTLSDKIYNLVH